MRQRSNHSVLLREKQTLRGSMTNKFKQKHCTNKIIFSHRDITRHSKLFKTVKKTMKDNQKVINSDDT